MSCPSDACPPVPPSPSALGIPPTPENPQTCFGGTFYYNAKQTFVDSCGAGSTGLQIVVIIPKDRYLSSISQADADNQAMAAAVSEADTLRIANPCSGAVGLLLAEGGNGYILLEDGSHIIL